MIRIVFIAAAAALHGAMAAYAAPDAAPQREPIILYNALEEAARAAQAAHGSDPSCPRQLDAPKLGVPIVDDTERLVGYAFTSPRICLTRGNQFDHIGRMHVINDRLVRAGHRAPMRLADDYTMQIDQTREALHAAAGTVIGEDRIDRIDLLGADVRYIR
ncbi:MAG: hypothetical protein ACOC05_11365 [Oceanicaulis sp.]